jgi:hypothetical protein
MAGCICCKSANDDKGGRRRFDGKDGGDTGKEEDIMELGLEDIGMGKEIPLSSIFLCSKTLCSIALCSKTLCSIALCSMALGSNDLGGVKMPRCDPSKYCSSSSSSWDKRIFSVDETGERERDILVGIAFILFLG